MKKVLYLLPFLMASCTCNVEIPSDLVNNNEDAPNLHNSNRSIEEAMAIAQQALSLIEDKKTRSVKSTNHKIKIEKDAEVITCNSTRGIGGGEDTLMYVFNFEDNQGFAIIAAPTNVEGLIAITEKGHFNAEKKSEVEGFEMFMEMAKTYVRGHIFDPIIQLRDSIVCIDFEESEPYISVRWGQFWPEGEFCPNGIAGCLNTALAQIMSYYEYPTNITLTYPNADKSNQSLNWTEMKSHATCHYLSDCAPADTAVHASISRLCRQLGHLNHSGYESPSIGGTFSGPQYTIATMTVLGYSTDVWSTYNDSIIRNNLDNGKLMLMTGGTHAWVVDGYETATFQIYTYARVFGTQNWWLDAIGEPYNGYLYHFNWGWYGDNNGYFMANVFQTSAVIDPDTNVNDAIYDFSYGVSFLPIWR